MMFDELHHCNLAHGKALLVGLICATIIASWYHCAAVAKSGYRITF
jgi:hypothetical protein